MDKEGCFDTWIRRTQHLKEPEGNTPDKVRTKQRPCVWHELRWIQGREGKTVRLDLEWDLRSRKGLGPPKSTRQGRGLDHILKADRRQKKRCCYDHLFQNIPSYGSPFLTYFRGSLVISHTLNTNLVITITFFNPNASYGSWISNM